MNKFCLIRYETSDEGTFGKLIHHSGITFETLELPWRDNTKNISCIPEGIYEMNPYISQRFGNVYSIETVINRSDIRLHIGNWAGDISKGFKSDSSGCILIGNSRSILDNQKAIINSTKALRTLKGLTGLNKNILEIKYCEVL